MGPGLPNSQGQGGGLGAWGRRIGQREGARWWSGGLGEGSGEAAWIRGGTGFVIQTKLLIKNSKLFYMYAALLL